MKVTNINSRPESGAFWNIVSSPDKVTHPCFSVVLPVDPAIGGCGASVVAQWSGASKGFECPPAIGEKVRVSMNNLGVGTVEGYFIESGYIGLLIKPDDGQSPDWWVKQNAGKGRTHYSVFGTEIRRIDKCEVKGCAIGYPHNHETNLSAS